MPESDAIVLADPSAHTVEEVRDVLGRSTAEEIVAVKEVEAQGKARRGILDFEPPGPAAPPALPQTDEQFGMSGWRERASWFQVDGASVSPHAIAGALSDAEPGSVFTQGQVQRALERFLKS